MLLKAVTFAVILGCALSSSSEDAGRNPTCTDTTLTGPQLLSLFEASGNKLLPGQELKASVLLDSTLHGKSPAIFHQYVDGVSNTYTVVTLRDPVNARPVAVLGGYTEIAWSSVESTHVDLKAFLFAFDKPDSPALITSRYKWRDYSPQQPNIIHSPDDGFNFGNEALNFSPARNPYTGLTIPSDAFMEYMDEYDDPSYYIPYDDTNIALHLYSLDLPQGGIWYNDFTYDGEAETELGYEWTYVVFTLDASSPVEGATATAASATAEPGAGRVSGKGSKGLTTEEAENRTYLRSFFKGRKGFLTN